uniref:TLC domain-containing protein n=1 Tax=Oryza rufipogon TaxID=4529 RepID=A0A0E0NSU5_ORYRU
MAIRGPEASSFFPLTLVFSVGFFCARFFLDRLVYKPLAAYCFSSKASKLMNDEVRQAKIVKFSESIWKLTYYGSVQAWVLLIIKQEPWSLDTMQYFEGWPNQYMTIFALVAWETRRKDFAVMMSHHVVTSILIGYAYLTGFFRIGTIILALHDASDVFLETAKLCKYTEKELGASLFFGLFALSWLLLRLIYFPFWIIKTSSYQSIISLRKLEKFPTTLYYIFNTMLLTLLVFHIYWWKLICLMIMKQLNNKGQVGEDVRSDSEDEE